MHVVGKIDSDMVEMDQLSFYKEVHAAAVLVKKNVEVEENNYFYSIHYGYPASTTPLHFICTRRYLHCPSAELTMLRQNLEAFFGLLICGKSHFADGFFTCILL